VQIRDYIQHNGAPRDLVFDLSITHERWGAGGRTIRPRQASFDTRQTSTSRCAKQEKVNKYQHTYANNHSISFLPAIFSTSGRIDAEFLRLLFYRESEKFFRLTGQLAQPNQDYVFSKRAAFFNGLKSKVGHIMAKATVAPWTARAWGRIAGALSVTASARSTHRLHIDVVVAAAAAAVVAVAVSTSAHRLPAAVTAAATVPADCRAPAAAAVATAAAAAAIAVVVAFTAGSTDRGPGVPIVHSAHSEACTCRCARERGALDKRPGFVTKVRSVSATPDAPLAPRTAPLLERVLPEGQRRKGDRYRVCCRTELLTQCHCSAAQQWGVWVRARAPAVITRHIARRRRRQSWSPCFVRQGGCAYTYAARRGAVFGPARARMEIGQGRGACDVARALPHTPRAPSAAPRKVGLRRKQHPAGPRSEHPERPGATHLGIWSSGMILA